MYCLMVDVSGFVLVLFRHYYSLLMRVNFLAELLVIANGLVLVRL